MLDVQLKKQNRDRFSALNLINDRPHRASLFITPMKAAKQLFVLQQNNTACLRRSIASLPFGFALGLSVSLGLGTVFSSTSPALAQSSQRAAPDTRPASSTLKRGLKALNKGDMKTALQSRAALKAGSLERKTLAWAIAMDGRKVDAVTLSQISYDLAHWPGSKTMRANVESALIKNADQKAIRVAFSNSAPETNKAKIALAQAYLAAGQKTKAHKTIAPLWQKSPLKPSEEVFVLNKLGSILQRQDHRARVEYLLSKRRLRSAERIAGKAGVNRMVKARVAVERKLRSASGALAAVPQSQRSDPNYLYSKAMHLRRAGKFNAAAKALLQASPKNIHPNFADQFWIEQRIIASDLLQRRAPSAAYKLAARNVARSTVKRLDAEFFAGWIALRKLNSPKPARRHFERLLKAAKTPLSKSRGHYWLGRALAASKLNGEANKHYTAAARYDTTYYGQLAARLLGRNTISISKASPSALDRKQINQYELMQVIAKLETAGQHRRARTIYRYLARHVQRPGELALLAARAERNRDYQLSLQIGKIGFQRGYNVDKLAWPLGAIPRNTKTSGAGLPLAYAIARQESTFKVDARSPANALGLLQLLPTTAKRTARSIGIRYSPKRLISDASYNARLGTAFLQQQMNKFGGSFILTFSAYNAGPRRAEDWIKDNGDPRGKPLNFVIDWVEQIPYGETRNYVQRVMENYQVYKTRLKGARNTIDRDLRAGK